MDIIRYYFLVVGVVFRAGLGSLSALSEVEVSPRESKRARFDGKNLRTSNLAEALRPTTDDEDS